MGKEELEELIAQHSRLENTILDKISALPNYGGECHCDGNRFQTIHNGNLFDEIMSYCLECGGLKV